MMEATVPGPFLQSMRSGAIDREYSSWFSEKEGTGTEVTKLLPEQSRYFLKHCPESIIPQRVADVC